MLKEYPDIMSLKDLMRVLDIGKNKAYELLNNKSIEHFRIGNSFKIPKISVINYIEDEMKKNKLL